MSDQFLPCGLQMDPTHRSGVQSWLLLNSRTLHSVARLGIETVYLGVLSSGKVLVASRLRSLTYEGVDAVLDVISCRKAKTCKLHQLGSEVEEKLKQSKVQTKRRAQRVRQPVLNCLDGLEGRTVISQSAQQ